MLQGGERALHAALQIGDIESLTHIGRNLSIFGFRFVNG
jgi:hypothetical protein